MLMNTLEEYANKGYNVVAAFEPLGYQIESIDIFSQDIGKDLDKICSKMSHAIEMTYTY